MYIPQASRIGTVEIQTSASFQPRAKESMKPAMSVVKTLRMVPRVAPDRPAAWVVSVDKKLVSAPALFSS